MRLPWPLLHRARRESPCLPLLLRACRDLRSARNELRWLRERIQGLPTVETVTPARLLARACHRRARGVPLQYILGDQPFGDLSILCRPGVLIPRPETEIYTWELADRLTANQTSLPSALRILDLCTGTGCIALLLYARLNACLPSLHVRGIDIDVRALALANANLAHNVHTGALDVRAVQAIDFVRGDVLELAAQTKEGPCDVLVCNPPYISHRGFEIETSRSARNHEPVHALKVIPRSRQALAQDQAAVESGDLFYKHVVSHACRADASLVVLEVGDRAQALRVLDMITTHREAMISFVAAEVWSDNIQSGKLASAILSLGLGRAQPDAGVQKTLDLSLHDVKRMERPRAIVLCTQRGRQWIR